MQLRKTFLALLVLALIGGLAFYISRQPEPQKNHKLFDLKPADIERIELRGPARDLVIERDGPSLWRIVKPVQTAADNSIADGIADAIAQLEVVDTVEEHPTDLANFGLENPATTIFVTTTDKRVLPGIMVGSDTPVGNNAYFKTTDSPAVRLTNSGFTVAAGRTLKELRSHALVGLTADQINRVVVTHPDGSALAIVRQGDGWMITAPRDYPADTAAVQQMLDAIVAARVDQFIEDNPTDLDKFGLGKPALQFEIVGGKDNATKETVQIGFKQAEADKKNVYARVAEGDQPVSTVADYIVKAVDKSFDDLRDKTVLPFDESNVGRITLSGGPVSILVERGTGDQWSVVAEGKTKPAKPEVASSLLSQLHDLKGTKIVEDPMTDPKPFGMAQPTLTATLADRTGKEIGSIYASEIEATMHSEDPTVKPQSQNFGYATSSMGKAVYQITPDQVIDLENTGSALKREVEPEPSPRPSAGASAPAGSSAASPPGASALPLPGSSALPPPGASAS